MHQDSLEHFISQVTSEIANHAQILRKIKMTRDIVPLMSVNLMRSLCLTDHVSHVPLDIFMIQLRKNVFHKKYKPVRIIKFKFSILTIMQLDNSSVEIARNIQDQLIMFANFNA